MKKKFIMLVGVPGSGKSTYVKNMFPDEDYSFGWMFISSDAYIVSMAEKEGLTYDEAFPKYVKAATKEVQESLKFAIENNLNIIWDQTNLNSNIRKGRIAQIPNDYEKVAVYFNIPDDLEIRLAGRPGKTIPSHVMESMIKSFEIPSLDEGFDSVTGI